MEFRQIGPSGAPELTRLAKSWWLVVLGLGLGLLLLPVVVLAVGILSAATP